MGQDRRIIARALQHVLALAGGQGGKCSGKGEGPEFGPAAAAKRNLGEGFDEAGHPCCAFGQGGGGQGRRGKAGHETAVDLVFDAPKANALQ